MSTTQTHTEARGTRKIAEKLEAIRIPVTDVDRAKRFYLGLGWRLDADIATDAYRAVQITPPCSACSIQFGKAIGVIAPPGSMQGMMLIVEDIVAARADLVACGAEVSDVYHYGASGEKVNGREPKGESYRSFATFNDPDGNGWLLQEVTTRLPGRVW